MIADRVVGELQRTKERLFAHGWHQGGMVGPEKTLCLRAAVLYDALPKMYCTSLGITPGLAHSPEKFAALDTISSLIEPYLIWMWNDSPERKFNEIIDIVDEAILVAKESFD